jgi:hypothetical protein
MLTVIANRPKNLNPLHVLALSSATLPYATCSPASLNAHVHIVPMSVKDPAKVSTLYIETLFETEFVPYANLPEG